MLDRIPGKTSPKFIHKNCFPCARLYYRTTERVLAGAALKEFWEATEGESA